MVREMVKSLLVFCKKCCGFTDLLLFFFLDYLIYLQGHRHFAQPIHLVITGPDDFINGRFGRVLEDMYSDALALNLVDIPSVVPTNENSEVGLEIIYVDHVLRPSTTLYGRLCQVLRSSTFPCVIIGNSRSINSHFLPNTITIYVPPPSFPLERYYRSPLIPKELEKMKNLMTMFWQKHLNAILENHSGFQPPPWLVNFALDFWPPLMVIADVIGVLWGKPIFKDKIFSLAEKIITSRKMDDSSITLEEKILQAVQGFIKATKPMDDDTRFYNGLFMLQYIRDMLDMPRLTPEKISEVLNRSGIVLERWRPRIEIDDEKRSTKKINVKKIIQVTCYHLNEEKLSELLCRNYPQEDRNGPPSN